MVINKIDDDEMLPGFWFHPTDEDLIGFYPKRKIQQLYIPIELIKQMDIYKHDPVGISMQQNNFDTAKNNTYIWWNK